jgi:LysR family transcriptional regulator, nitrogen assimilation regulatory protein
MGCITTSSMDLRQLRTFQSVAELGSLSKASDHLHVAEPALSRQIKLLEHELKTTLFIRNGRGMILTDAGRLLMTRTAGLVRQVAQIKDDIISLAGSPSGSVALGIVPTASSVLAGRLAQRVSQELPGVALRLVESYGGHLVDWLHRGEIDLSIIYGQPADLHLHVEPLACDELVIVGPPGSGLEEKSRGALSWLAGQRLLLPSKSHGLRQLLERAAERKGLQLTVMTEADSFRALIQMVERGLGYSVLPPSAIVHERAQNLLEAVTLQQPRVVRNLVLAWPMVRPQSLAVEAVSAIVKRETEAAAEEGIWMLPERHGENGGRTKVNR